MQFVTVNTHIHYCVHFLFDSSVSLPGDMSFWRHVLLQATFISVFSFPPTVSTVLVWFGSGLSCDHGWIGSGSVNVKYTTSVRATHTQLSREQGGAGSLIGWPEKTFRFVDTRCVSGVFCLFLFLFSVYRACFCLAPILISDKRGAQKLIIVHCCALKGTAPVTGTTLRTTGPVPADSR